MKKENQTHTEAFVPGQQARPLVKVCGLTSPTQMQALAEMGVDYLGMIFYEKSPRNLTAVPSQWESVEGKHIGVFVHAQIREVMQKVAEYQLAGVQLHGDESPEYLAELKGLWPMTTLKAFSVDEEFDFEQTVAYEGLADYFLFDTKGKQRGGNGFAFDWSLLQKYAGATPFFLSGGLSPESLQFLLAFQHPSWVGVDLNSGFETHPGQKDLSKLKTFIEAFRNKVMT